MKGFVRTPDNVVDRMVARLFHDNPPSRESNILDPGCGTGVFVEGILRWCRTNGADVPNIVGIELDPKRAAVAKSTFRGIRQIRILNRDFLEFDEGAFDYVVGNPPYVPITDLSEREKRRYRSQFLTARRRFDLYILFFEQAIRMLRPGGRLVFITPEKFLYVQTAEALRHILAAKRVELIEFLDEETFGELVTYPIITTVVNSEGPGSTTIVRRSGSRIQVVLDSRMPSWQPLLNGTRSTSSRHTLADVSVRVSCGIATGSDSVFVRRTDELSPDLRRFAHPTIAGREIRPLKPEAVSRFSILVPYGYDGTLLEETQLGALRPLLREPANLKRLMRRTCVKRKPWYAFHENPPLPELLRPKILCKDITERPIFVIDEAGSIVPRHSLYYIVPKDPTKIRALAAYLNSAPAQAWLRAHCQRAANGYLRVQSRILQQLPVPARFVPPNLHDNDEREVLRATSESPRGVPEPSVVEAVV